MNNNQDGIKILLKKALNNKLELEQLVASQLKKISQDFVDAICDVLEKLSKGAKQPLIEVLAEIGSEKLYEMMLNTAFTQKRSCLLQVAEVLTLVNYLPLLSKMRQTIFDNAYEDFMLPLIRIAVEFEPSSEATELFVEFITNCKNEVKLSSSFRHLLRHEKTLVPALIKNYNRLNQNKRVWVLKFFSETANPQLVGVYRAELEKTPLVGGLYAVRGLSKIATQEAVDILLKHLSNEDWFFRKRIVEALGQTKNISALDALLKAINDVSMQVRAAAAESLSKIGGLQPEKLVAALKAANHQEKINLINAMGQIKDASFVEPLVEILREPDLLFFSIDALGDLGNDAAIPHLKRLLSDDVWFNRLNALEALSKLNVPNIDEIAAEALKDENDMVKNAARRIMR